MKTILEGLLEELKKVSESVLNDLPNWRCLSLIGACYVRQLISMSLKASEQEIMMTEFVGEEQAVGENIKLRIETLINLRNTFESVFHHATTDAENLLKSASNADFIRNTIQKAALEAKEQGRHRPQMRQ
jgi:hypothetical protein